MQHGQYVILSVHPELQYVQYNIAVKLHTPIYAVNTE